MAKYPSHSISDTQAIAQDLAPTLSGGDILALSGNLGSGKTVFVKALCKYFGIDDNIVSPTFVLLKVYQTKHKKISRLVHVDCYRLDKKEDLSEIGLHDFLEDKNTLVVIEWADKISHLPKSAIKVNFKYINQNERTITIER